MNVERAIECNSKIKSLKATYQIDTTHKDSEEVSRLFMEHFIQYIRGERKDESIY